MYPQHRHGFAPYNCCVLIWFATAQLLSQNWATAWQNQQNDLCAQRSLRSDWTDTQWVGAQADLSLHWPHKSFCWFCPTVPHRIREKPDSIHTYTEFQHRETICANGGILRNPLKSLKVSKIRSGAKIQAQSGNLKQFFLSLSAFGCMSECRFKVSEFEPHRFFTFV